MVLAKTLFGALGAAAVGASECANATLAPNLGGGSSTDMAVDSKGTVWLTTISTVTMCPVDGKCTSFHGNNFFYPLGIAVDDSDSGTTVYVSDFHGVSKCTLIEEKREKLDCVQFGSGWNSTTGLALDHEGNVLVTNNGPQQGVWKCSPSADCVLVGGSDRWPADVDMTGVGADSKGNIYVAALEGYPRNHTVLVKKCTIAGTCEDFGSLWDWDQLGKVYPAGQTMDFASIAVGPDDYVYISDRGTHSRCSPVGSCEHMFSYGIVGNMAIDQDGIVYIAPFVACPHEPGCLQLELRKFCFDLPTDILQV